MKNIKIFLLFYLFLTFNFFGINKEPIIPDFGIYVKDNIKFNSTSKYFVDSILNDFEVQASMMFLTKRYIPKFWINNILSYAGSLTYLTYKEILYTIGDDFYLIYDPNLTHYEDFYDTLSLGFDNIFLLSDKIKLTLGYHHYILFNSFFNVNFKFRPYLYFTGFSNIGISWELETFFYFFYDPSEEEKNERYDGVRYELQANIGIEFLQLFLNKKKQKIFSNFLAEYQLLLDYPIKDDVDEIRSYSHTFFTGFNLLYYLFKPYIYAYFKIYETSYYFENEKNYDYRLNIGFKTGFEITKYWLTFGLDYIGSYEFTRYLTWINAIETYIKFEI